MPSTPQHPRRFGRRCRITRRKDISRLFEQGRRGSDSLMMLLCLPTVDESGMSRAGVAVSKRHGGAVRRNRIKRLCREAFRLTRHELPAGWDYMIVPRVGSEGDLQQLRESLRKLARKIAKPDQKEQEG